MRKFLSAVFASLLLAFSVSLVAFGSSGQSPSQICDANNNYGVSHSTCVLCVAQGALTGPFTPTCACKIIEDAGLLEANGFDNLGQCISSGLTGEEM